MLFCIDILFLWNLFIQWYASGPVDVSMLDSDSQQGLKLRLDRNQVLKAQNLTLLMDHSILLLNLQCEFFRQLCCKPIVLSFAIVIFYLKS